MVDEKEFGFWLHFVQDWFLNPCLTEEEAYAPLLKWKARTGKSLRHFYEAFASLVELPLPDGSFNEEYGEANLPYLIRAYWEEEDWQYRLYVCFSGMAGVAPAWHCFPSYRFMSRADPSERFDFMEDTTSPREERLRLKFKGKRKTTPQVAA